MLLYLILKLLELFLQGLCLGRPKYDAGCVLYAVLMSKMEMEERSARTTSPTRKVFDVSPWYPSRKTVISMFTMSPFSSGRLEW